jgi:hypothetical protein
MQLTLFSDYALRVGLYLASHPERLVPAAEVSRPTASRTPIWLRWCSG